MKKKQKKKERKKKQVKQEKEIEREREGKKLVDNQRLDRYTGSTGKKRNGKNEEKASTDSALHLTYGVRDKRADCARLQFQL